MKFAHTGDLHIGKRLHEKSLLEEQREILWQILDILLEEQVDALIIAGDIYDKPTPSVEAVRLFDDFVSEIENKKIKLIAISGNHDSMERVSFGSRIMSKNDVYFQENFSGKAQQLSFLDKYGKINLYLLPFIKPIYLGKTSYEEAFIEVLENSQIDYSERNILVAHQYFTGGSVPTERCESEVINIGGLDNISYEVVKDFDYVALGHLHKGQFVGQEHIRYSGSPYKYSFSESNHNKGILIVDVKEKGNTDIRKTPLTMPKDLRVIKGALDTLVSKDVVNADGVSSQDYICAVITDKEKVVDAASKLLRWYPNLLKIEYLSDEKSSPLNELPDLKGKTPMELFEEYYEMINGCAMKKEEIDIVEGILGGDKNETA